MYLKFIERIISNDCHTKQIDIFHKKCRNEKSYKHNIEYNIICLYYKYDIYDICK